MNGCRIAVLVSGILAGSGSAFAGEAGAGGAGGGGGAGAGEVLVFLKPGTDAEAFGASRGLVRVSTLRSTADGHVFAMGAGARQSVSLEELRGDGRVRSAYSNQRTVVMERQSFVPNDPLFFASDSVFSGYRGQWYLSNSLNPGRDVRIMGAWERGFTGAGVVVGVVDDSVDIDHPDLAPNASLEHSFDFGENDLIPNGVTSSDRHGTAVAGIIAARGGNGIGMSGGAPLATLAGLRVDFPNQTVAMFVDATLYRSSGESTAIKVKNHSYGVSAPFAFTSADVEALAISAAAGTIHTYSAGNNRGTSGQDSNKKDLQKSVNSITVAALGSSGVFATYSNFGACVFVTAPSSSNRAGEVRSPSTDRLGGLGYNQSSGDSDLLPDLDYTSSFGGTSASSPVVAGVMTLLKEANPAADGRFAKHILARTSDVVDAGDATTNSDGGWRTNGAGFRFNQNYGFGLVDADEVVQLAPRFVGVTPLVTAATPVQLVGLEIPDNDAVGLTQSVEVFVADAPPLEEVLVNMTATHTFRGDMEAFLTSPSGYSSRIFIRSASDSGQVLDWQFTMNAFWGESVNGTWSLLMTDRGVGNVGTLDSFSLEFRMGSLITIAVPEPGVLSLLPIAAVILGRRRARR